MLRTNEKRRNMAQVAESLGSIKNKHLATEGVLGITALSELQYLDLVSDIVIDYMHTVCLGVVKAIIEYWFSHSKKW